MIMKANYDDGSDDPFLPIDGSDWLASFDNDNNQLAPFSWDDGIKTPTDTASPSRPELLTQRFFEDIRTFQKVRCVSPSVG